MKKYVRFFIFSVCLLSVLSCGSSIKKSIPIKGIYLGMDTDDFWKIVSKEWKHIPTVGKMLDPDTVSIGPETDGLSDDAQDAIYSKKLKSDGTNRISWNFNGDFNALYFSIKNRKLVWIKFESSFARRLHDLSRDTENREFSKKLEQVYGIKIEEKKVGYEGVYKEIQYIYEDVKNNWILEINFGGDLFLNMENK